MVSHLAQCVKLSVYLSGFCGRREARMEREGAVRRNRRMQFKRVKSVQEKREALSSELNHKR